MEERQAVSMFSALSQGTRLQIVRYLVECGETGAAAGEVGEKVGATSSRVSFHLAKLENTNIISSERQSRKIIYRANFSQLGGLVSFLLDDCCGGHPDIMSCCKSSDCNC